MTGFYVSIALIAAVGVFSSRKVNDLILMFKILLVSVLAHLLERGVVPLSVGFVSLCLFFVIILVVSLTMTMRKSNDEDEVDRI